jgi:hypothetical protein
MDIFLFALTLVTALGCATMAGVDSTGRCNTVGFSVLFEPEV